MHELLRRNWWAILLRGIAAILFGLIALVLPGLTLGALILVFGIYALAGGTATIVAGLRASARGERWGSLMLEGALGIVAGLVALSTPAAAARAFAWLVAGWAFATGLLQIVAALRLRRVIETEWLMGAAGVLSIVLGVAFAVLPGLALITLTWWLGGFAMIFGGLMVALAFRLRRAAPIGDAARGAA